MRSILNISMSPALKKEVDIIVKEYHYSSVSEFFRDAIREWKRAEAVRSLGRSRREIAAGKGKVLRSLQDLM